MYDIFDILLRELTTSNYPVTNGGVIGDKTPFIEVAVTGCSQEDIEVTFDEYQRTLRVKASPPKRADVRYRWRKLAQRPFTYEFMVADRYEVEDIKLANGILTIMFKESKTHKANVKQLAITAG